MIKPNWQEHLDTHGRMPDWFIAGEPGPPVPEPETVNEIKEEVEAIHRLSEIEFDVGRSFQPGNITLRTRVFTGKSSYEHAYVLSAEEAEGLAWALSAAVRRMRGEL